MEDGPLRKACMAPRRPLSSARSLNPAHHDAHDPNAARAPQQLPAKPPPLKAKRDHFRLLRANHSAPTRRRGRAHRQCSNCAAV